MMPLARLAYVTDAKYQSRLESGLRVRCGIQIPASRNDWLEILRLCVLAYFCASGRTVTKLFRPSTSLRPDQNKASPYLGHITLFILLANATASAIAF